MKHKYHICNDYSLEHDSSIVLSGKRYATEVFNRKGEKISCFIYEIDGEQVYLATDHELPNLNGVYI